MDYIHRSAAPAPRPQVCAQCGKQSYVKVKYKIDSTGELFSEKPLINRFVSPKSALHQ